MVIMALVVIVWQLSVKYDGYYLSVKPSVCYHRWILSVGNDGMTGNCLATLCESPTNNIRRYLFKIYIKK